MNRIEDFLQLNSSEKDYANANQQNVKPFWSGYEIDYQRKEQETLDFFETRVIERVFVGLRSDIRFKRYSLSDIEKMYELVRRYIHLMGSSFNPEKTRFRIDDMSYRSIEVRYSQRNDVSVNLYINDKETDSPDYEESYVSYTEKGQHMLLNNTIDGTVDVIKRLLAE